jgi:Pyruvate phosphate dikinase, AMP/ATP-binding domain
VGRTRGDHGATIPAEIADAIDNAYRSLGTDVAVAVRSSGTTEDAGDSSFAGLNASFTNVIRLRNVLARVNDCWASLYGERVLALSGGATSDRQAGMGRSEAVRPGLPGTTGSQRRFEDQELASRSVGSY